MMPPKLMATKVFPSPDMVDVTEMILEVSNFLMNSKLVLTERNASEIMDFGFLSTSNWEFGMSFLYRGTTPSIDASVYFTISPIVVILLCIRYRIRIRARLRISALTKQTEMTTRLFGNNGMLGTFACFSIRLLETYPALEMEYSAFLSTSIL